MTLLVKQTADMLTIRNDATDESIQVPIIETTSDEVAYQLFITLLQDIIIKKPQEFARHLAVLVAKNSSLFYKSSQDAAKDFFSMLIMNEVPENKKKTIEKLLNNFFASCDNLHYATIINFLSGGPFASEKIFQDQIGKIQNDLDSYMKREQHLSRPITQPQEEPKLDKALLQEKIIKSKSIKNYPLSAIIKDNITPEELNSIVFEVNDPNNVPLILAKLLHTSFWGKISLQKIENFYAAHVKTLKPESVKVLIEILAYASPDVTGFLQRRFKKYLELLLKYAEISGVKVENLDALLEFEKSILKHPLSGDSEIFKFWRFDLSKDIERLIDVYGFSSLVLFKVLNELLPKYFTNFGSVFVYILKHKPGVLEKFLKDPYTGIAIENDPSFFDKLSADKDAINFDKHLMLLEMFFRFFGDSQDSSIAQKFIEKVLLPCIGAASALQLNKLIEIFEKNYRETPKKLIFTCFECLSYYIKATDSATTIVDLKSILKFLKQNNLTSLSKNWKDYLELIAQEPTHILENLASVYPSQKLTFYDVVELFSLSCPEHLEKLLEVPEAVELIIQMKINTIEDLLRESNDEILVCKLIINAYIKVEKIGDKKDPDVDPIIALVASILVASEKGRDYLTSLPIDDGYIVLLKLLQGMKSDDTLDATLELLKSNILQSDFDDKLEKIRDLSYYYEALSLKSPDQKITKELGELLKDLMVDDKRLFDLFFRAPVLNKPFPALCARLFELDLGRSIARDVVENKLPKSDQLLLVFLKSPNLKYLDKRLFVKLMKSSSDKVWFLQNLLGRSETQPLSFSNFKALTSDNLRFEYDWREMAFRIWRGSLIYGAIFTENFAEMRGANLQSSHLSNERILTIMLNVKDYVQQQNIITPTYDDVFGKLRELILDKILSELPDDEYSAVKIFIRNNKTNLIKYGTFVDMWPEAEKPTQEEVDAIFNNASDELYIPAMRWLNSFKTDIAAIQTASGTFLDDIQNFLTEEQIKATDFNNSSDNYQIIVHAIIDQFRYLFALKESSSDPEVIYNIGEQIVQQCSISQREVARPGVMETDVSCKPGTLGRFMLAYQSHPAFSMGQLQIVQKQAVALLASVVRAAMQKSVDNSLKVSAQNKSLKDVLIPIQQICEAFTTLNLDNCIKVVQGKPVDLSMLEGCLTPGFLSLRQRTITATYPTPEDFIKAVEDSMRHVKVSGNKLFEKLQPTDEAYIRMIYFGFVDELTAAAIKDSFDQVSTSVRQNPSIKEPGLFMRIKAACRRAPGVLSERELKNALTEYFDFYCSHNNVELSMENFVENFNKIKQTDFSLEQLRSCASQSVSAQYPKPRP